MLQVILSIGLCWGAEPAWRDLYSPSAESSSFLKSNWNKYTENYHPAYALDDNPVTAWVEGVDGDGVGESITIPLSSLKSARSVRLQIRNGYQKSEMLFNANGVAKDVKVSALWNGQSVVTKAVTLEKKMGWQEVIVTLPAGRGLDALKIELGSVYAGKSYKDTCISDIKVSVDTDVAYNAAYEESKRKLMKLWVSERIATAKYFASQPKEYPFGFTNYETGDAVASDPAAFEAQVAPLRQALTTLQADPKWYRAEYPGKPLVLPDGLSALQTMDRLIQPSGVSFTETADAKGRKEKDGGGEDDFGSSTRQWSNYKVRFAAGQGSAVQSAAFSFRSVDEGRGTYVREQDVLVQYDAEQHPTLIYISARYNDPELGEGTLPAEQVYRFEYGADHKVSAVKTTQNHATFEWPESGEGDPKRVVLTEAYGIIGH